MPSLVDKLAFTVFLHSQRHAKKSPMDVYEFSEDAFRDFMLQNLENCFPPGSVTTPKRYAVYLPSRKDPADIASESWGIGRDVWNNAALESTLSVYSRSSASSSLYSSLAQGGIQESAYSPPEALSHSTDVVSDDDSVSHGMCPKPSYESHPGERSVKFMYRQSSHDALMDARQEAIDVVKMNDTQGDQSLVCSRPGCQDRLKDLRSLTCHLHIHNMTDGYDSDDTHHSGCHLSVPGYHLSPGTLSVNGFRRIISKVMRRR